VTPAPHPRRLDIIVPIYKNAALVRTCVESILEHIGEVAAFAPRLILINDSPADEEVTALLRRFGTGPAAALVLKNETNLGFVRSVNRGLDLSERDGHDVLIVNSDTRTFPGTLAELMNAVRADPQIAFASPRSNNASICSLPHHSSVPAASAEETHRRWSLLSRTMPAWHFAPTAVGFYMFIAHPVLANHGGLSEDFGRGYEEENDLVMRAGKVGGRAIIVNRAFAYHEGSASFNLTDLDVSEHKLKNLLRLQEDHPEFLPLVKRYEESPHYRAEHLMTGLLPDADGRMRLVFDLSEMGQHYNGTNEQAVAVLRSLAKRQGHRLRLAAIGTAESFRCHGLDRLDGLHREEPDAPGLHGIAVRLAQPFELDHISALETLAPINVFAMLDTIAEDCGPLAIDGCVPQLWDHVAEQANGLVFTSRFTQQTFFNRHPAGRSLPHWQSLLPTRLSSYAKPKPVPQSRHVLVIGNHFAHKGSVAAGRALAVAFPDRKIVVIGPENVQLDNLTGYRSGLMKPAQVDFLFNHASVVVLPSYVEGFGLGLMHALAAGRPIVARRIPATEEILASLDEVEGVFLFDDNAHLVETCARAMQCSASRAQDGRGASLDDWADGLADFCLSLAARNDIFERLVGRLKAGDRLRRAARGDALTQEAADEPRRATWAPARLSRAKPVDLESLLAMDGREFVEHAYATLLRRPVDEGGLQTYLGQLELGVDKVDLLESLANSAEGRLRGVELPGLAEIAAELRRSRLPLLKRIFTA
jgi:GT2 family glycosyltransferase